MQWRIVLILVLSCLVQASFAQARDVTATFHLGPGDVLQVSVWKDEALTRDVLVTPDGFISFPLIGQVQAAGRTLAQVQAQLQQGLEKYVPDSPVTVALRQLNSRKVYVVGKVNKPGTSLLQGKMTVMQALAASGGFTRFADRDAILILRTHQGQKQAIPFDYSDVSQGRALETDINLQPGDIIVVP